MENMNNIKKQLLFQKVREKLFLSRPSEDNPITEQQLADELGVSRSPVRDALRVMDDIGVLERKKKKGVYLKPPSLEKLLALYDVRSVLEGLAARLAATKIKAKDITALRDIVKEYHNRPKNNDVEKWSEPDWKFHEKIIELSGNPWLKNIMDDFDITGKTFRVCTPDLCETVSETPFPHEMIIDALVKGDPDECDQILRDHIQYAKRGLMERVFGARLNVFEK